MSSLSKKQFGKEIYGHLTYLPMYVKGYFAVNFIVNYLSVFFVNYKILIKWNILKREQLVTPPVGECLVKGFDYSTLILSNLLVTNQLMPNILLRPKYENISKVKFFLIKNKIMISRMLSSTSLYKKKKPRGKFIDSLLPVKRLPYGIKRYRVVKICKSIRATARKIIYRGGMTFRKFHDLGFVDKYMRLGHYRAYRRYVNEIYSVHEILYSGNLRRLNALILGSNIRSRIFLRARSSRKTRRKVRAGIKIAIINHFLPGTLRIKKKKPFIASNYQHVVNINNIVNVKERAKFNLKKRDYSTIKVLKKKRPFLFRKINSRNVIIREAKSKFNTGLYSNYSLGDLDFKIPMRHDKIGIFNFISIYKKSWSNFRKKKFRRRIKVNYLLPFLIKTVNIYTKKTTKKKFRAKLRIKRIRLVTLRVSKYWLNVRQRFSYASAKKVNFTYSDLPTLGTLMPLKKKNYRNRLFIFNKLVLRSRWSSKVIRNSLHVQKSNNLIISNVYNFKSKKSLNNLVKLSSFSLFLVNSITNPSLVNTTLPTQYFNKELMYIGSGRSNYLRSKNHLRISNTKPVYNFNGLTTRKAIDPIVIRLLEDFSGKNFWINHEKMGYMDYMTKGNGPVSIFIRQLNRYFYRFNRKVHVSHIVKILHICLVTQDLELLRYTSKYVIKRLRVHEQRQYFQMIGNALKYHFTIIFEEMGVKGFHYEVKGKIGMVGKARKRKIQTKLYKSSRSEYSLKVIELDEVFSSKSGALSFKMKILY